MTLGEIPAREGMLAQVAAFVRRRRWLVGGAVLMLAGAVGVIVLLASPAYPLAAWPPRCTGTATHSAAPTTLVEPVPANADAHDVMHDAGRTLTLDETVLVAKDRGSRRQELRQDGFVDASDQSWFYGGSGAMVNIRLLRFSSTADAGAFLAATVARIAAVYGKAHELPGAPGSFYFAGDVPNGDPAVTHQGWEVGETVLGPVGYALSYATFCVGDTVAVVYLWAPGPDRALARAVVRNQYIRL